MKKIIFISLMILTSIDLWSQTNTNQNSFMPIPGEQYVVQAWVRDEVSPDQEGQPYTSKIEVINTWDDGAGNSGQDPYPMDSDGVQLNSVIIDGWQLIQYVITLHEDTTNIEIRLTPGESGVSYFDDIRFFPFNGNLKSFVYDPENQRLLAELDENNYATIYEYDYEGGLVRIKKETERGIKTIQETRSGSSKLNN